MKYHRLSRYKIKRIILCFSEDVTASSASKILHINRNTINAYYNEIREKILQYSLKEQEQELGEFELDESYFGARRVRGKRGRGVTGKTPVLGLLKKKGKNVCDDFADPRYPRMLPMFFGQFLRLFTIVPPSTMPVIPLPFPPNRTYKRSKSQPITLFEIPTCVRISIILRSHFEMCL